MILHAGRGKHGLGPVRLKRVRPQDTIHAGFCFAWGKLSRRHRRLHRQTSRFHLWQGVSPTHALRKTNGKNYNLSIAFVSKRLDRLPTYNCFYYIIYCNHCL